MNNLEAERTTLIARTNEIDALFEAGQGTDALSDEYQDAHNRIRAIGREIQQGRRPTRRICPNTAALVAANID